jgi:cellulose synthase/poly-beta-1,6-N-acetylglucosamine synthase-like glycosyltransferase
MINTIVDVLLVLLAAWLAIPCLVMIVECLAASPRIERASPPCEHRPRIAVLVPAHNEEVGIHDTVAALRADIDPGDRLLVVADNCTDGTADLASAAGAEVVRRMAPQHKGKGYALAFGVEALSKNPPDVVVVVDADCRIEEGGIAKLANLSMGAGRPAQAEYLFLPPGRSDPRTAISTLALTVRNCVRPRGLHRLGLPCPLTGSGMAFPWRLVQAMPELGANLVEDMILGIELGLRGTPPLACPEVTIKSTLPVGARAQMNQRRRWECGHLASLRTYGPRLFFAGLARRQLDLIAMALDLMVPPLALLALLLMGAGGLSALNVALGGSQAPLLTIAAATVVLTLAVVTAWSRFARAVLPLRGLATIPFYIAWKVPLYVGHLLRRKPGEWQRTARTEEAPH